LYREELAMLRPEIIEAINEVLHDKLDGLGFVRAEITEDEDHEGDPILSIVAHYEKSAGPIDPTPTFSLARVLKERIRPLGEERFPHLTHLFSDDQQLKVA
jgi:hypothetical protein